MPPIVTLVPATSNVTAACFLTVSVVIIASAASSPSVSSSPSSPLSLLIPPSIISIGSCLPITPVDAMSTESAGIESSCPALAASALQLLSPSSPVQALATPLLMTTACAYSELYTTLRSHLTGAAYTLLVVNVPAVTQAVLENTIAISFFTLFLIPTFIPVARKPLAAVTPPFIISIF